MLKTWHWNEREKIRKRYEEILKIYIKEDKEYKETHERVIRGK